MIRNHPELDIQDLLRPEVYPHAVENPSIVETHVSWIVLTGPFAYKIKKAIKLDFLDATQLAHRRFLCEEELRLNRRFAPEIYLDVVAITSEAGGLAINGAGEPIEYAVRMRQFDREDELSNCLHRDVTATQIVELARSVAAFHSQAAVAEWTGTPVRTQSTTNIVLDNVASVLARLDPQSAAVLTVETTAQWLRAFLSSNESFLAERERTGFVRESHGDLHSHNIVRYRGRLVPFDCLEFDPNLRWIDVCDDIAFLTMDLASRGRKDFAYAFTSGYLESTGDYAALRLLPFFATHRALVRAKVDLISAQGVAKQQADFMSRFAERLRAAQHWSTPRAATLVLMHGVSGSGKSWLSERLIASLPAIRLRSDLERKRLAGLDANASAASAVNTGLYSPEFDRRTYTHLADCAEIGLRAGFDMIVDATFLDPKERERFLRLAERVSCPFAIVACEAPREILAARIAARTRAGERTSDADIAVLDEQLRTLQPFTAAEAMAVVKADTSSASVVHDATAAIRSRRAR